MYMFNLLCNFLLFIFPLHVKNKPNDGVANPELIFNLSWSRTLDFILPVTLESNLYVYFYFVTL
jgi:hypothetical protein